MIEPIKSFNIDDFIKGSTYIAIKDDLKLLKGTKISGIYRILNTINNRFYIGSSINVYRRVQVHFWALENNKHVNKHLQADFDEFKIDAFVVELIEHVENINLLLEREQHWMNNEAAIQQGYNAYPTARNTLGQKLSEETKEKMKEAHKNVSNETRVKLSKANSGVNNSMYGKHHSFETRVKISNATKNKNKGISFTEEHKQKISENSSRKRKVICIETQQIFDSIAIATKWAGLKSSTNINRCCTGERSMAGNYHWKYFK